MAHNNGAAPRPTWPQVQTGQQMFPYPQYRYPSYGVLPPQANGDVRQLEVMGNRMVDPGMMAPPPMPHRKDHGVGVNGIQNTHPMMIANRSNFIPQQQMMPGVLPHEGMSVTAYEPQIINSHANESSMSMLKQPTNSFGPCLSASSYSNSNIHGHVQHSSNPTETKALEAHLNEILHPTQSTQRALDLQNTKDHTGPNLNQTNQPTLPGSHPAVQIVQQLPSRPPSIPNDLKNVMPTMFDNVIQIPQTPEAAQLPHSSQQSNQPAAAAVVKTLPAMTLPPASHFSSSHQQAFNMAQNADLFDDGSNSGSDREKMKRKRRKRCGGCPPCQQKADCGECYVCKNKGQVNAICKLRKCMLLRKKAAGSESGSLISESSSFSQVAAPDSMFSSKSPRLEHSTTISPVNMLGHSQISGLHQHRQQSPATPLSAHITPPPMSQSGNHVVQPQQNYKTQGQPFADLQSRPLHSTDAMFQQAHPSRQMPMEASGLSMMPQGRHGESHAQMSSINMQRQLKHSSDGKVAPSPPTHPMASFRSLKTRHSPWSRSRAPHSFAKPNTQQRPVYDSSISQEKLHDLYNTFKDDMQKMNERTYVRANGVKVCKLMSKLLALKITDDELRSSQPPKPPPNLWEQFLPDSITDITSPASINLQVKSEDPLQSAIPGVPDVNLSTDNQQNEPLQEGVDGKRQAETETDNTNSQATMSDIEDGGQTIDSQAVDSGFSSSSPADRQSPSPKTRFDIPIVGKEHTNMAQGDSIDPETINLRPIHKMTESYSIPSSISETSIATVSTQEINRLTSVPSLGDGVPSLGDKALGHSQTSWTASQAAATFERPSEHTSLGELPSDQSKSENKDAENDLQNSLQRIAAMAPILHQENVMNATSASISQHMSAPQFAEASNNFSDEQTTVSFNKLVGGLTSQITGTDDPGIEQNSIEPTDPAYLIKNNKIAVPPNCSCTNREYDENVEGPYYVHLGTANSIKSIRELMEERTGFTGSSIRIEKVRYTTKEGRTSLGCPAAKWIVRRSSEEEQVLVITKHRPGHYCATAWIIIAVVVWEGIPSQGADHMYDYLTRTLPVYGYETERRCGTNQPRDCACQGWDMNRKGASFSFGCSWSVYYNGCKFARSHIPKKFKLRDESFEGVMESKFQALGQHLAPLYKQMAPMSYGAQVRFESKAGDCRIGFRTGRPFSGVTATVDFCAHQHRDTHNMNNGCTVVVTLTKHRGLSKPDDEQLHTLPMYCLEDTDEYGQKRKDMTSGLESLHAFSQDQRRRSRPYKKRKKGTETYQSPKVKAAYMDSIKEKLINDTIAETSVQQQAPPIPLPQERESAKQDLFNTSHKDTAHQLCVREQPNMAGSGAPHNPVSLATTQSQPTSLTPASPYGEYLSTSQQHTIPYQQQAMVNQLSSTSEAHLTESEAELSKSDRSVPQPVNVLSEQSHPVQQKAVTGTPPISLSQPQSHFMHDHNTKQEGSQPSEQRPSVTVEDIVEGGEGLNPPKPRPPSPEYDDPEGREVHEDNPHLFRDPNMGGVALALSHGAVLFEVAKRELHATTALRQPDRYNPTRISLVFYQHKRLNFKKHGYQEYQRAEEERQKARKAAQDAGVEYIPKGLKYKQKRMQEAALRKARLNGTALAPPMKFLGIKKELSGIRKKPGRKVGWRQRKQLKFAAYQYLWPQAVNHAHTRPTTTATTRWMKPECFVTGPYQKWISLIDVPTNSESQHSSTAARIDNGGKPAAPASREKSTTALQQPKSSRLPEVNRYDQRNSAGQNTTAMARPSCPQQNIPSTMTRHTTSNPSQLMHQGNRSSPKPTFIHNNFNPQNQHVNETHQQVQKPSLPQPVRQSNPQQQPQPSMLQALQHQTKHLQMAEHHSVHPMMHQQSIIRQMTSSHHDGRQQQRQPQQHHQFQQLNNHQNGLFNADHTSRQTESSHPRLTYLMNEPIQTAYNSDDKNVPNQQQMHAMYMQQKNFL